MATTFGLTDETEERVRKLAAKLGYKKLSTFMSAWVNESLDALESDRLSLESPLLRTWRAALGKPTLIDSIFEKVCSAIVRKNGGEALSKKQYKFFLELLLQHGHRKDLSDEQIVSFCWNQAGLMTQQDMAREKALEKLGKAKGSTG